MRWGTSQSSCKVLGTLLASLAKGHSPLSGAKNLNIKYICILKTLDISQSGNVFPVFSLQTPPRTGTSGPLMMLMHNSPQHYKSTILFLSQEQGGYHSVCHVVNTISPVMNDQVHYGKSFEFKKGLFCSSIESITSRRGTEEWGIVGPGDPSRLQRIPANLSATT